MATKQRLVVNVELGFRGNLHPGVNSELYSSLTVPDD